MARPKKVKQIEDNPTTLEEPVNANVELFYNTKPVFFSHNSIDQIHPLDLDRYFTWVWLPKVALNWINQTEATINLSIDGITQFKLSNWFHFGDVYFNVMSYKMISQTGNNKVYQYHLKMNIHNTFLPKIFTELKKNPYQNHLIHVKRSNYCKINGTIVEKKLDPMLDFSNKNYVLIRSMPNPMNTHVGITYHPATRYQDITIGSTFPDQPDLTNPNYSYLYFAWGTGPRTGNKEFMNFMYKTIKWYVWKNNVSKTYCLIPSIASRYKRTWGLRIGGTQDGTARIPPKLSDVLKFDGFPKGGGSGFNFFTNDEDIEKKLVNSAVGTSTIAGFRNQNDFVGAFFGPAIMGGVWTFLRPEDNDCVFPVLILENNVGIQNGRFAAGFDTWTDNLWMSKIYMNDNTIFYPFNYSYNPAPYLWVSNYFTYNTDAVGNLTYGIASNKFIYENIRNDQAGMKIVSAWSDAVSPSLIAPKQVQFSNQIITHHLDYVSPTGSFSYSYPETNIVITDAYTQYLNSVRASQDTSISIAKQQMDLGISKNVLSGIGGVANGIGQALNPLNLFNPGGFVQAGATIFNSIAGAATGTASEVLAYQNKQKEIDAANLDKQNSIGANVLTSSNNNQLQNLIYAYGFKDEAYIFHNLNPNPEDFWNLHPLYWTSMIGKMPTNKEEINSYLNYMYWYGIYIDEKLPVKNLNKFFNPRPVNTDTLSAQPFYYLDATIEESLIMSIFGSINMEYREMIKTIFENGMRLYVYGWTPSKTNFPCYHPIFN